MIDRGYQRLQLFLAKLWPAQIRLFRRSNSCWQLLFGSLRSGALTKSENRIAQTRTSTAAMPSCCTGNALHPQYEMNPNQESEVQRFQVCSFYYTLDRNRTTEVTQVTWRKCFGNGSTYVNLQNVGRDSAQSVVYNLEFKQKPAHAVNKLPAIQGQSIQIIQIQTFAN